MNGSQIRPLFGVSIITITILPIEFGAVHVSPSVDCARMAKRARAREIAKSSCGHFDSLLFVSLSLSLSASFYGSRLLFMIRLQRLFVFGTVELAKMGTTHWLSWQFCCYYFSAKLFFLWLDSTINRLLSLSS